MILLLLKVTFFCSPPLTLRFPLYLHFFFPLISDVSSTIFVTAARHYFFLPTHRCNSCSFGKVVWVLPIVDPLSPSPPFPVTKFFFSLSVVVFVWAVFSPVAGTFFPTWYGPLTVLPRPPLINGRSSPLRVVFRFFCVSFPLSPGSLTLASNWVPFEKLRCPFPPLSPPVLLVIWTLFYYWLKPWSFLAPVSGFLAMLLFSDLWFSILFSQWSGRRVSSLT